MTKSLEKTTEVESRERTPNKTEPEKHPAYSPLKKVTDTLTNKILMAWSNHYFQLPFTKFFSTLHQFNVVFY